MDGQEIRLRVAERDLSAVLMTLQMNRASRVEYVREEPLPSLSEVLAGLGSAPAARSATTRSSD